jgi:hypothetical protein
MRLTCALLVAAVAVAATTEAQTVPPPEAQIAGAVQAAPEDRRAGAMVLGFDASGTMVTLRKGTNDMVCLADNPAVEGFNVACYHKDLEPFMARGRELVAQGVTDDKVRQATRFKEIEAGTLPMSKEPRTLYVLTGKAFDAATNTVEDSYLRWVLYVPFATPETTGLQTKAAPGAPWLMDAGTAGAHIMISPPRQRPPQ